MPMSWYSPNTSSGRTGSSGIASKPQMFTASKTFLVSVSVRSSA